MPFSISATAVMKKKTPVYLGSIEGYLCRLQSNYGSIRNPINIEGIAEKLENTYVHSLTLSILNEKDESFPIQWSTGRQWCREGHFFALVHEMSFSDTINEADFEVSLFSALHDIIQIDCCIPIDSLFVPVEIAKSKIGSGLRKAGFSRLSGCEGAYFARHSPLALLEKPTMQSKKEKIEERRSSKKSRVLKGQISLLEFMNETSTKANAAP